MTREAEVERTYMTVRQAADAAHVDPNTIRRWMTAGKLTKYKIEGRVLVDQAELDRKIAPAVTGVGA
jgi:excisionase family DNA binding protein